VLEPSCCAVFRDELHGLMPDSERAQRLAENTFTLSEFLERNVKAYEPLRLERKAIVQAHCHHKAIMRVTDDEAVMQKMGLGFEMLNSGCCGMAGSFGFEGDKYEVSQACGERSLFPAVRAAEPSTLIVADGFSCREQIQQDTPRRALHLAEVMQMALHGEEAVGEEYPEIPRVQRRQREQRLSMKRAGIATGLLLAVGALLWRAWRRRRA